jgi:hypothetical protein
MLPSDGQVLQRIAFGCCRGDLLFATYMNEVQLLGAFAKLGKSTISPVMSACLS